MGCLRAGLVGSDPPQQVRAGGDRLAPQGVGEEPAVGSQHHPRLEALQQRLGQGGLRLRVGSDLGCEDRMRPALGQRATATRAMGKAARSPLLTPGRPKCSALLVVSATSRHIPSIATSLPPSQPHPRRLVRSDRPRDPLKQRLHPLSTQPGTGLENR